MHNKSAKRLKKKISPLITGDPTPHLHSESKQSWVRLTFQMQEISEAEVWLALKRKLDIRYSEKEKGPFLTQSIQAPEKG